MAPLWAVGAGAQEKLIPWWPDGNIHPKFKGGSNGGLIDDTRSFYQNANEMMHNVKQAIAWLDNWKEHVMELTVSTLSWVYDFLANFILQTPAWLFSSEWFVKIAWLFGGISVFLAIILWIMDGIKAMVNKPNTSWNRLLTRLPLAIIAAGFAPLAFDKVFYVLNKITSAIVTAGHAQMKMETYSIADFGLSTMDAITLLGFDIVLVGALLPITLTIGRRWFDLLALGGLTPVALTTWVFKEYEHYHSIWWHTLKRLSLVQLYYAVFITFIGLLIMGAHATTIHGLVAKLLVIAGGLWRMAVPPAIVKRHMDNGAMMDTMYRQTADVLTFKPLKRTISSMQLPPSKKSKVPVARTHRQAKVKREKLRRKIVNWFKKK